MNAINNKDDLVIGKIYHYSYNESDFYIFQCQELINYKLRSGSFIRNEEFKIREDRDVYMVNMNALDERYKLLREATYEETLWFNQCLEKGEFIAFDQINKEVIYETY